MNGTQPPQLGLQICTYAASCQVRIRVDGACEAASPEGLHRISRREPTSGCAPQVSLWRKTAGRTTVLQPDLDEYGHLARPPLREYARYIGEGMSCILKLMIESKENGVQSVQFSMTPDQCRALAQDLITSALVIELERPTKPQ